MTLRDHGWVLLLLLLAHACGNGESAVRLTVLYDESWELDELNVSGNGRSMRIEAAHEVLVWVNDAWAEEEMAIEVSGLRDGKLFALGRTVVTPGLDAETTATLILTRLHCGAWCTVGAIACETDGVAVCEQQPDGCMQWSTPTACPSAAPYCSFGVCDTECVNECEQGERRCAGPEEVEVCAQGDSDACTEWVGAATCEHGQSCSAGSCASGCQNECEAGAVRCQDGGASSCDDRNFDGCTEWGPSEPCAEGERCDNGVCGGVMEEECSCFPDHAIGRCVDGSCTVHGCLDGHLDCNGVAADGCEVDPMSDVEHCGGCGGACTVEANGAPLCDEGTCAAECAPGFLDCDQNPTNGCERAVVAYVDGDGDGVGIAQNWVLVCEITEGLSATGNDCDDADERVFPGQNNYFTQASTRVGFDYNCDGVLTRSDTRSGYCSSNGCSGSFGWTGSVPSCGHSGSAVFSIGGSYPNCSCQTTTSTQSCH